MIIRDIVKLIDGTVYFGEEYLEKNVEKAFSSDLMSDVLAHADENTLLLTGMNNQQVIRTAEMLDLRAIVFVRGKTPHPDIIKLAKENNIVIISTKHTLYVSSGILYCNGLSGITI